MPNLVVFSGSAHPQFAQKVVSHLHIPLGAAAVSKFSDGEISVEITENVRGKDVFIVQSTCAPTNDNLMEILVMADALRRASAGRITAVIPYFGYARQDRRPRSARVPITAKVVADMLTTVGIDRVVMIDLHADQIQGFFDIPVDNIYGTPALLADLRQQQHDNLMVVSPDVGGVVRARAVAKQSGDIDLAIIDKRRAGPNEVGEMNVVGDVRGKLCVIIDDMVDTAGTITKAADIMKQAGAKTVRACASHCVMSGPASERVQDSALEEIVFTDSIPYTKRCAKVKQISIADMFAETIRRVEDNESISSQYLV